MSAAVINRTAMKPNSSASMPTGITKPLLCIIAPLMSLAAI